MGSSTKPKGGERDRKGGERYRKGGGGVYSYCDSLSLLGGGAQWKG